MPALTADEIRAEIKQIDLKIHEARLITQQCQRRKQHLEVALRLQEEAAPKSDT